METRPVGIRLIGGEKAVMRWVDFLGSITRLHSSSGGQPLPDGATMWKIQAEQPRSGPPDTRPATPDPTVGIRLIGDRAAVMRWVDFLGSVAHLRRGSGGKRLPGGAIMWWIPAETPDQQPPANPPTRPPARARRTTPPAPARHAEPRDIRGALAALGDKFQPEWARRR